jgi:hypothetical protein
MAFKRIIYTSDTSGSELDIIKQDINRLINTKNFQIKFPNTIFLDTNNQETPDIDNPEISKKHPICKITIKPSVKPNTLIVDINGEGANSIAKKLKDLGNKNGITAKIKTDIKLAPVKESKLMKKSEFKTMIKEEIFKTLG